MSNQLTEAQRYAIYLGLKRKWSKSRIAAEIGVSKSTVSREVRRNSKPDGSYVWKYAQAKCDERRHGLTGNHRKPEELWWRIDRMHERPAEADGKRFGDWEMDTIVDAHGHAILTLTERSTNFILIERLKEGRKAAPTAKAVVRLLLPYRKHVKTITTDNGCEFAAHMEITKGLAVKGEGNAVVYFADSYSAWQKGAIENANKLIRKYMR